MSSHVAFRRQALPQQYAQNLKTHTLPAPTRGIVQHENEAYMQPGGCIVCDNWFPTMRGAKLRGGCVRHCDLHALDGPVPPVPSASRQSVISMFEYTYGSNVRIFAAQQTKLFDVTAPTPVLVKSGQTSGNYATAQMSNLSGNYLIAVNDTGQPPLRFDGTTWLTLDASAPSADQIKHPTSGLPMTGLTHVWKYLSRLFFVEGNTMNLYYLDIDSIAGTLKRFPLSGAATRGGSLLFGANWSVDAGDGLDNKCVMATNLGEILLFSGTDPSSVASWRQEGRYDVSPPLGKNAHTLIGGDLMILTVDGIVPLSQVLTKSAGQLELAMVTRSIKPMWREEVTLKRTLPWTIKKWDEQGIFLVTWPGGSPGNRYCAVANNATGAWARAVGWDALCFARLGADLYFGNQDGIVMLANRTGKDDGAPYVATYVGGWETFGQPAAEFVWHQARAVFSTGQPFEPFEPQLTATVDYEVTIPPPPPPGADPGLLEVWDQGKWDQAHWDQPGVTRAPIRNSMWQSIGMTGFAHAPIVQVTVAQQAPPNVEIIAITATFEPAGVNV
ncbi:hypothetical protein EHM76_00095 [bacterium]|nr:MAG: hypothetical protein EHM76_00095 [bacterium]